ncbi:MAG: mannonate dehydratase [Bryobacteraceae bacterium]
MTISRRHAIRLAASSTAAGLLGFAHAQSQRPPNASGIKLGAFFTDRPEDNDIAMLRHAGIDAVSIWTTIENNNVDWMLRMRRRLDSAGIELYNVGILDLHCDATIVLGLPGIEQKIEQYQAYLTNLGKAGIHYTTYAHIANIKAQPTPGFYQTAVSTTRGDASTREFDLGIARKLPNTFDRTYSDHDLWATFTRFIRAVIPAAERAQVKIGIHPDDPPVDSLGGVARIFRNFSAYERAFDIARSPNLGACLCIGTWAEGGKTMGKTPVEAIRALAAGKRLFKIHFRNVSAPLPVFRETFIDNGYIDMYQVMLALERARFTGIVIPDHVPGGGYPNANNAYTLGYMKALRDRASREA